MLRETGETRDHVADRDGEGIVGRPFPAVLGHALSGEIVRFPQDVAGAPAVLLIAYRRAAQPDIERWLAALARRAPATTVYEVPARPSLVYRPPAGWIDAGMRGGVPKPQWRCVVTIYGDGSVVRDFVGEASRPVAHAVVLGGAGVGRFFHADGLTDGAVDALVAALHDAAA
ncbi:MAG: hypothetical protein FJ000_04160 [Actinobacteria bacterium]|nr:hypothetical protein [Actinomycetota bacterium]